MNCVFWFQGEESDRERVEVKAQLLYDNEYRTFRTNHGRCTRHGSPKMGHTTYKLQGCSEGKEK